MIPMPFNYHRAASIDDALAALANADGGKLIAGGHSLIPLMKLRLSEPATLVDIARLAELRGISEQDGALVIGAATSHWEVESSPLVRAQCPVLADVASGIGDPQVRNRGTIGGSLAHADPAADYPAAMLALDAELQLRSARGARTVKANDFFQGMFTVDLAPDEMIVAVRLRAVGPAAYAKLRQRASHFAIVGVAAALTLEGGTIRSARVGITGAGPHATRLTAVEQALEGQVAGKADLASAAARATLEDVNSDIHASENYRRAMIPVMTRRALEAALKRA
jgi:aerobic carbon-monoxide dehydrogenase medium subunit